MRRNQLSFSSRHVFEIAITCMPKRSLGINVTLSTSLVNRKSTFFDRQASIPTIISWLRGIVAILLGPARLRCMASCSLFIASSVAIGLISMRILLTRMALNPIRVIIVWKYFIRSRRMMVDGETGIHNSFYWKDGLTLSYFVCLYWVRRFPAPQMQANSDKRESSKYRSIVSCSQFCPFHRKTSNVLKEPHFLDVVDRTKEGQKRHRSIHLTMR